MTNSETISVIVPAAGCGARAALNGNKILAALGGRPVLAWTLQALHEADFAGLERCETIVVARPDEFATIRETVNRQTKSKALDFELVEGGATRQDSVYRGVLAARGAFVLVHDAARPCVSSGLVARTIAAARQGGAAIAALAASDTVKVADAEGNIAQTLDRSRVWLAQTPQVFRRDWFLEALQHAQTSGFEGTDCASLMEHAGRVVALVEGEASNLKITFAADLERAGVHLTRKP